MIIMLRIALVIFLLAACGKEHPASSLTEGRSQVELNVVFNLADSAVYREDNFSSNFVPIVAAIQSVFDQANVVMVPQFEFFESGATPYLDVRIRPRFISLFDQLGVGENGSTAPYIYSSRNIVESNVVDAPSDYGHFPLELVTVPDYLAQYVDSDSVSLDQDQAAIAQASAHEIGHAINLDHTYETGRLMVSGGTGIYLTQAEITRMRAACSKFD